MAGREKVDSAKDFERSKNIYERKMFDKRLGNITGEKTEKGERYFKPWLFDIRKVSRDDVNVHEYLGWIAAGSWLRRR